MDYIDAIRARCLLAVVRPDSDAWLRHIFRWYAKECSTPLHQVESLPLEHVLTHYFEARYEELESPLLQEELLKLSESAEEREARLAEEALQVDDDDEFYRAAAEEAKKESEKQLKIKKPEQLIVNKPAKESDLPDPNQASLGAIPLPEINMNFSDDSNLLARFEDSDPLSPPGVFGPIPTGKKD